MNKTMWCCAGGFVGALLGVGACKAFAYLKARRNHEEEPEEIVSVMQFSEVPDIPSEPENDEDDGDDGDDDASSILKVSPDAARKLQDRGTELKELLYFPDDGIFGGWETEGLEFPAFIEIDEDFVFAAFEEERRLTPTVKEAWYVFEGKVFHVKTEEESTFAEVFDRENQLIPPSQEE